VEEHRLSAYPADHFIDGLHGAFLKRKFYPTTAGCAAELRGWRTFGRSVYVRGSVNRRGHFHEGQKVWQAEKQEKPS
jgi:hypothetical protein